MTSVPEDLLARGADELGIAWPPVIRARFHTYLTELTTWNRKVNLTGTQTASEIVHKHFLDSLAVAPWVKRLPSLLDLGCGAGFPGLPLKLAFPHLNLTLVEANGKKINFLRYLTLLLGLDGVEVIPAFLTPRLSRAWGPRAAGVITRATLPLGHFFDLAAPLTYPGGWILALKGPNLPPQEWSNGCQRATLLGLGLPARHPYVLPLSGVSRLLVAVRRLP